MSALAEATTAYACLVALACTICCLRPGPRPPVVDLALATAGLAAVAVAATGAVALVGGARPTAYATHLGYLVTTPLLLPVTAIAVRGDHGRWGSAAFATGCLVLAVVAVRTVVTGRA